MSRRHLFALPLVLVAPLGLAACGGDGDASNAATTVRQGTSTAADAAGSAGEAVKTATEQAGEAAKTATEKAADAAEKARSAAQATGNDQVMEAQQKIQSATVGLQRKMAAVSKKMQDGSLSAAEGQKQLMTIGRELREQTLVAAEKLDRAGKLPNIVKEQMDHLRKALEDEKK